VTFDSTRVTFVVMRVAFVVTCATFVEPNATSVEPNGAFVESEATFFVREGVTLAPMGTELDDARYVNLLSYKRDGTGAQTPVWAAPLDGKLVIFTGGESYKVKRIRRNPKVRVARCDARGALLGPWLDGTCAFVEEPARQARIIDVLKSKYGWQMRLLDFFSTLSGRAKKRAYLEVTLAT
jgi:uncharacterized protein